jgi:CRISPR-associated protein Cmr2
VAQVDDHFRIDVLRNAVLEEWNRIAKSVKDYLSKSLQNGDTEDLLAYWDMQVSHYWEINVNLVTVEQAQKAGRQFMPYVMNDFQAGLKYTGRIAAASKQIRHFQPHEVYRDQPGGQLIEDTRPKCSMFASMAQMGPIAAMGESQMELSRRFWEVCVTRTVMESARLQPKDRLCAVALVKRYAYACYFQRLFCQHIEPGLLTPFFFPDIDTVCSRAWLDRSGVDPFACRKEGGGVYWSGRWLRWRTQGEGQEDIGSDGGEECPSDETWMKITEARKSNGAVPVYYAALMLDGDKMGDTITRCQDQKDLHAVSSELGRFAAQEAIEIVERHYKGKLVYAGGDDVLALLPAENGLECANALKEAFSKLNFPHQLAGNSPSCTVAIVVAHYKHPLHAVLAKLRAAERFGKQQGGNCLALTVAKRSGEETCNKVEWGYQLDALIKFVRWFQGSLRGGGDDGAERFKAETDRWVYRFRQILPVLADQELIVHRTELVRLLSKAQLERQEIARDGFLGFFDSCNQGGDAMESSQRFAQLIQSASFIARNQEK